MSLHDRMRGARKDANLSVNAFAKKVGVSSTAAWNWDWEYTTPTPDKMPKIAEVLGVSVAYLTGANVAPSPPARNDGGVKGARETLDVVLTEARTRIASLLGIEPARVEVTFNLKG